MSDTSFNTIPANGGRPASRVESAIARASQRTDVDFGYLFAQAKVESSLDPAARARTSSATGLFQFIESTWLDVMRRHGGNHGYGQYAAAIEAGPRGGRVADPLLRGRILALRNDPQAASLMAGALAQDNRDALRPVLGRDPDAGELYLAHFLGSNGAGRFLTALNQRPGAPAATEFASPAQANRGIFYTPGGQARSFAGVMDILRSKIENAMPDGTSHDAPHGAPATFGGGDFDVYRREFARVSGRNGSGAHGPADRMIAPLAPPAPPASHSISELLQHTFALGNAQSGAGGDHARRAYDRLRVFGL